MGRVGAAVLADRDENVADANGQRICAADRVCGSLGPVHPDAEEPPIAGCLFFAAPTAGDRFQRISANGPGKFQRLRLCQRALESQRERAVEPQENVAADEHRPLLEPEVAIEVAEHVRAARKPAARLAADGGALVSPGEFYGPAGAAHVRLAMVRPDEQLELLRSRLAAA